MFGQLFDAAQQLMGIRTNPLAVDSAGLTKGYPAEAPRLTGLALTGGTAAHVTFATQGKYLNIQNKATSASNLGVYIHYGTGAFLNDGTQDATAGDDYIAPGEQLSYPIRCDWVSVLSPNGGLTINGNADNNLVLYALT